MVIKLDGRKICRIAGVLMSDQFAVADLVRNTLLLWQKYMEMDHFILTAGQLHCALHYLHKQLTIIILVPAH